MSIVFTLLLGAKVLIVERVISKLKLVRFDTPEETKYFEEYQSYRCPIASAIFLVNNLVCLPVNKNKNPEAKFEKQNFEFLKNIILTQHR